MCQLFLAARRQRAGQQPQLLIEGEKAHSHKWDRLHSFGLRRPLARPAFASFAFSFLVRRAVFHTANTSVAPLRLLHSSHCCKTPEPHLAAFALVIVPTAHPALLRFRSALPWDAALAILSFL